MGAKTDARAAEPLFDDADEERAEVPPPRQPAARWRRFGREQGLDLSHAFKPDHFDT